MPFFVPGDVDLDLQTRSSETRLPGEFGANPFRNFRDISYTNKKTQNVDANDIVLVLFCSCYVLSFLLSRVLHILSPSIWMMCVCRILIKITYLLTYLFTYLVRCASIRRSAQATLCRALAISAFC